MQKCIRLSKFKNGMRMDSRKFDHAATMHEGIKSLKVDDGHVCDFSTDSNLCICIITWNLNGQVVYEDLVELIGSNRRYDLLVAGFQEVPARKNIAKLLQEALVDSHILVGKIKMKSIHLYVFGPNDSSLFVKELRVDKHSIGGFGGLIGRKKGAVAIRINYRGIRMQFISCHLSAHAENVEERNSECHHISHYLFSKNWNPYARPAQITVWLGDLNYRLQGIDTGPVRNLIQNDQHRVSSTNLIERLESFNIDLHDTGSYYSYSPATDNDQLLQEAKRGQVFNGYCEGTLTFKPTYKYNARSNNYDTSYKVRVPSWTDRILFKIQDSKSISASLHSYESVDEIHSSDHKPVKAHICLKLNN